jgi:hypothetical protein
MNPNQTSGEPTQDLHNDELAASSTPPQVSLPTEPSQQMMPQPPQAVTPGPISPQRKKHTALMFGVVLLVIALGAGAYVLFGRGEPVSTVNTSPNPTASQEPSPQPAGTVQDELQEAMINDEKRKNDSARLIAAITEYMANNNGKLPTLTSIDTTFLADYISSDFKDPVTKAQYMIVDTPPKSGEMQYRTGAACGTENEVEAGGTREAVVRVLLTDGSFFCSKN